MAVLTIFFNLFIFLMSLHSYTVHKHWTPCEIIITAVSVASMAHQLACYFWMTMDQIDRDCRLGQTVYTLIVLTIFSLKFAIMWTTSFLTFYYSTKLVTAPIHCYTKIQEFILKHVTTVVFLIPLVGLGICMPMLVVYNQELPDLPYNSTAMAMDCGVIQSDVTSAKVYKAMYLITSDLLPGLITIKCCVSISVHLGIHLRHMKASSNGAHAPKLGTQMRVIKMTLSLVVMFICFLVVDLYDHYQLEAKLESSIVLTFCFTSVYTTVSAVILIYGKKTFWKSLIHSYNVGLDAYLCLSCLKVPEHKATSNSPPHTDIKH
ncbi:taste receptor, type 2, member 202 [Aplochiton taeniatus]